MSLAYLTHSNEIYDGTVLNSEHRTRAEEEAVHTVIIHQLLEENEVLKRERDCYQREVSEKWQRENLLRNEGRADAQDEITRLCGIMTTLEREKENWEREKHTFERMEHEKIALDARQVELKHW
jgi:hypothetical protein